MKRTPARHDLLRRAGRGENVGATPGTLVDALVRAHLIAPGISNSLTDDGQATLERWDAEEPFTVTMSVADWREVYGFLHGAINYEDYESPAGLYEHLNQHLPMKE